MVKLREGQHVVLKGKDERHLAATVTGLTKRSVCLLFAVECYNDARTGHRWIYRTAFERAFVRKG